MKNKTTPWLLSSLLAVLVTGTASAQPSPELVSTAIHTRRPVETVRAEDKVRVSALVNAKVLRSFEESFKEARHIVWTKFDYELGASFKIDDRRVLALFSRNGRLLQAIYYGTAKHLPDEERRRIEFDYPDYEITVTQEVTINDKHLWLATVQNDREYIQLRVMDGELEALERFNRARQ